MANGKLVNILLVEDNRTDVEIMRRAFANNGCGHRLSIVTDGKDALELLEAYGRNSNALRPDLVMLDLGLPGVGGLEVLRAMKSDNDWRDIPVIVISGSDIQSDIQEAYRLNACAYFLKPHDTDGYDEIVAKVEDFWNEHASVSAREMAGEF